MGVGGWGLGVGVDDAATVPNPQPPIPNPDASVARVVVNVRASRRATTYDYLVPPKLRLEVGQLVWVPFGARRAQGIVCQLADRSAVAPAALRAVEGVVAPEPALRPHQIELAHWISRYYACPLLDAALLMLPSALRQSAYGTVALTELPILPSLDPTELRI